MGDVFEGHGYRVKGKALFIGSLPGRKQVCLYVEDGHTIRTLAFFRDHGHAREVLDFLDALARS